ncbi:biotin--[acetyl-CoA-carboxylase] ligase [Luteipulveratus mongoliensis]|uniref:biotin--[biotin carboxyl-carrier protein] ligase n=1 Tax=Luteipulveratus mongoliensis TaxID=571913 RepID=A0A0K1JHK3_9MICO|nr:biotin--[acetyl-CoA-carboxylase] ligase [Luteipulveratus mongoliensis]AKU16181.1 hypothetical protein VV02_10425 [Luteipulveratus mongoliensis]
MSQIEDVSGSTRLPLDRDRLTVLLEGAPWADVVVHETVGSTNAELVDDARPWRVVTADHQQQGRGRMARTWQAPPRSSIALSVSLPLPASPEVWGWVPLLVGATVRTALVGRTGVDIGLKWPNDVLARRAGSDDEWRKVAGILCQTATAAGTAPLVVVGIGLNVDLTEPELPVQTATSLTLSGAEPLDREQLIADILDGLVRLQRTWEGEPDLGALRAPYVEHCVTLGQQVDVHLPDGSVRRGLARDIDATGRLVVEGDDGLVPHAVGDVVHVRAAGAAGPRSAAP